MRPVLNISVAGRPKTGKTTVMRSIVKHLNANNFDVTSVWDPDDGAPRWAEDGLPGRLLKLSRNTRVTVTEIPSGLGTRGGEASDEFQVKVSYTQGVGYRVSVMILNEMLVKDYPDLPASKERSRALAARMAQELGVDVLEEVPQEYERTQTSDFTV
jgi:Cdc6-like AAA superfamily ATPase